MTLLITTSNPRKLLARKDVAQRCSEHLLYEELATSCPGCLLPKQLQYCERVALPPRHTTIGHDRMHSVKQLPTRSETSPPS